MKRWLTFLLAGLLLAAPPVLAHHPASDIVDEEIYAMIDALVSDTPHATISFDDTGGDMLITIRTQDIQDIEAMIADGLITQISGLSGRVSIDIQLRGGGRAVFTVTQLK